MFKTQAIDRVRCRLRPVDENQVVVPLDRLAYLVVPFETDVLRAVLDIAQPEHEPATRSPLQSLERWPQLSGQAERQFVNHGHVGPERGRRRQRDARAQRPQLLGLELEPLRVVIALAIAAAPRQLHDVDARRQSKRGLNRRSRENQRAGWRVCAGKPTGQGQRPPQMAEPDQLVGVEDEPRTVPHGFLAPDVTATGAGRGTLLIWLTWMVHPHVRRAETQKLTQIHRTHWRRSVSAAAGSQIAPALDPQTFVTDHSEEFWLRSGPMGSKVTTPVDDRHAHFLILFGDVCASAELGGCDWIEVRDCRRSQDRWSAPRPIASPSRR